MELKLGLHLTPTHLTHPLFDCVQHCAALICLIRHPSASFIVCKMRQIRAFLSYFGFRSRQNNPCDVLGAMPGRLLPQAFYATHHCQSQHCLCHLQQWLNIQQRESRLWTKWAARVKAKRQEWATTWKEQWEVSSSPRGEFDQGKRQKCLASNKLNCLLSDRGLLSAHFTE